MDVTGTNSLPMQSINQHVDLNGFGALSDRFATAHVAKREALLAAPVAPASEAEFRDVVLKVLGQHFSVAREVHGQHWSGRAMRLDAVLRPKVEYSSRWLNGSACLGVEFKLPDRIEHTRNVIAWLAQAQDYADTRWDEFGYMHVFACPCPFATRPTAMLEAARPILLRFLAHRGVGILRQDRRDGWQFVLNDSHVVWSERKGPQQAKHHNLDRVFGSR